MSRTFYVTTPLYYVNDNPHIGHAYTTVIADVLARYHRLFGDQTLFLTGTDEHGQKVQNAAQKANMLPQPYVDQFAENFKAIWKELDVSYDIFMRTTHPYHEKAVQDCLMELFNAGDIYSQDYEGWYSVSEERFYTEKELVNGKSPNGDEVSLVKEKSFFFKMSKYQAQLIQHIESNPKFIQPENRRNEVLGFLRQPLADLCISRPKARLSWGIELPFDKDYVTYVWFDALLNYATAVGLKQLEKTKQFETFWPEARHIIGKDIIIFHSVYFTTMLLALKAPLPRQIFAHGWWLTESNEKMSKSKGAVVRPLDIKSVVGVDGLRYFLTRDVHFGNDAQFSGDLVISRVNSDLANNLGNLLSRSTNLVAKFFEGSIPDATQNHPETVALIKQASDLASLVKTAVDNMIPNLAVEHVTNLLTEANRYLENQAPWKVAKTDLKAAGESLYTALEVLRISGILLSPVMPTKMSSLLKQVGWSNEPKFVDASVWGLLSSSIKIGKADPLFPRIETPK